MISLRSKLAVVLSFGLILALYAIVFFDGSQRFYRLWYYLPAAMVAGSFIVDRLNLGHQGKTSQAIDLIVGICCLMRPIFNYPPFSGHTVFSVYVILTCPFWSTRLLGAILLLITLHAKLVLWKGDPTLIPGLWIGLGAGVAFQRLSWKTRRNDRTEQNQPL